MVDGLVGEVGNIIGDRQTVDQVHDRRPSAKSPIKGLYFCSADTGIQESAKSLLQIVRYTCPN
ncbi:MAG: hypothetical protein AB2L12_01255 [Smithellaceae bacterium]